MSAPPRQPQHRRCTAPPAQIAFLVLKIVFLIIKIAFHVWKIAVPVLKIAFPVLDIVFPVLEIARPVGTGIPQKALRGVIPGDGFAMWGRIWSHFGGNSRPKMTNLSTIDF